MMMRWLGWDGRSNRHLSGRILHQKEAAAFDLWLSSHREDATMRGITTRVMLRFLNLALTTMFDTWREEAQSLKLQRQRLTRMAARLVHAKTARALSGWREACEALLAHQAGAARACSLFVNGAVAGSFMEWRRSCLELKNMRQVMARLLMKGLVTMLEHWRTLTREANQAREVQARAFGR